MTYLTLFLSIILPLFVAAPVPFKAAFVTLTGVSYYMVAKKVEIREVEVREAADADRQPAEGNE